MNFERLPRYIFKDDYILLDKLEVIKEKDIPSFLDSKKKRFLDEAYNNKKMSIIQDLEEDILNNYISKSIKEFASKSYLIESNEEDSENNEDDGSLSYKKCYNKFSTLSNAVLRQVKKDRKNDYDDVLKKLKEMLLKNDEITIEEESEDELEEVLKDIKEGAVDEHKKRLEKYLNKKYGEIYSNADMCFSQLSRDEARKEYLDREEEMNKVLEEYIKIYKKNHLTKFSDDLSSNIVNLYDMIIKRYYTNINFINDTSKIYLVNPNSFVGSSSKYLFQSGRGRWSRGAVMTSDKDKLERFGCMFTLLLSGDNSIKEIMEEE